MSVLAALAVATAPAGDAAATAGTPLGAGALGQLLTYDYGNTRSGDDPVGPPVGGLSAAPAWNDAGLDGAVYGQPLVFGGRVYVATEADSLYALSAATGRVIWKLQVGSAPSLSVVDGAPTLSGGCGDIDPLGVTGTPVIDPARGELFLAEETLVSGSSGWQGVRHWLVAVSLAGHRELWHRDVDPPGADRTYYIPAEQQRPALTLANGRLYVPFGGLDGDCGQYHGYVVALAESGGGALESYQVPTQREGAVWETDGALVSAQGDLYVATGNGSASGNQPFDEGDAVIELSPSLRRLGVWAPANWSELNATDADLGSGGPVAVPGSSLLFEAGKPTGNGSFGYLMREGHLGGVGRGAYTGSVCGSGGVFGADATDVLGSGATARTLIFAPCGGGTQALEVDVAAATFRRLWSGPGDGSPIVAGGLVWALNWGSGELYGMEPASGSVVVERTTEPLDHFVAPAAGDGMLFVPTASGVEAFRALS